MAALALAAAGAGVGSMIGGTFLGMSATSLGWSLGSMAGNLLFAPKGQDIRQEGPRLGDLKVISSTYGNGIPRLYGAMRVSGNVIWSADVVETRHESTSGGGGKGGGGGSVTTVTYTYSQSLAVALCEGEITGVRKIWANGKLIYNLGAAADLTSVIASSAAAAGITVYTGSETQTADATIEAGVGAGQAPAYRGTAYVVFTTLQLADFGNRMPNLEFEVLRAGTISASTGTQSATTGGTPTAWAHGTGLTGQLSAPNGGTNNVVTRRRYNYAGALLETKVSQFAAVSGTVRFAQAITNGGAIYWLMRGYTGSACSILNQDGAMVGDFLPSDYGFDGSLPSASYYSVPSGLVYVAISPGVLIVRASDGELISAVPGAVCPAAVDESGYLYSFNTTTGVILKMDSSLNVLATYTMINNSALAYTRLCGRDGNDWYFGNTYYTGTPYAWKITTTSTTIDTAARLSAQMNGSADTFAYLGGGAVMTASGAQVATFGIISTTAPTLASIVTDICTRTGLVAGDLDVTGLSASVHGYVTQRSTARSQLQPLMQAFYFDAVESNGKIKFVTRGGASAVTISEDDLAAHEFGSATPDPLNRRRAQDMELPLEVDVQYMDTGAAYQIGAQTSRRQVTHSENKVSHNLAIAMTATKAKEVADVAMYDAWTGRTTLDFVTGWKYSYLEPTDVITLTVDSRSYVVRLTDENASGGLYQRGAVLEDASAYTQTATAAEITVASEGVAGIVQTNLQLLDIPLLRDQDDGAGFYAAAAGYGTGWLGAQLYKSTDDGASWAAYGTGFLNESAIGWANTALGDFTQNIFDESGSVSVVLASGELASDTEINVLNGANVALLGSEIIQFRDATLTATDTYTLTGLLRGRRGTEWARSTHSIGDRFVLLSATATYLLAGPSAEYDVERLYRAATFGGFVDSGAEVPFTNTAVALIPYAPAQLGGGRNAAGDLTLNWVRRTRISGAWNSYADVPLGEDSEAYEVEIYSSNTYATLKRTITGISAQTTSYTAADQTTDFGSAQATVYFIVYQVSATVGRGYEARGVI